MGESVGAQQVAGAGASGIELAQLNLPAQEPEQAALVVCCWADEAAWTRQRSGVQAARRHKLLSHEQVEVGGEQAGILQVALVQPFSCLLVQVAEAVVLEVFGGRSQAPTKIGSLRQLRWLRQLHQSSSELQEAAAARAGCS